MPPGLTERIMRYDSQCTCICVFRVTLTNGALFPLWRMSVCRSNGRKVCSLRGID
jgi:ferric iron reductase protein FhuF